MIDYKKIIKSRKLRFAILDLLSFIPDEPMVRFQYLLKTGRKLHLNNPKRYTEKLQCYKLFYRNPLMKKCVDKYDVREYVKSKGLGNILVKNYGIFSDVKSIDWSILPNRFVIKSTTGGGGNNIIIVKDKNTFNYNEIIPKLKSWLVPTKEHSGGREWVYYNLQPRIIIDEFIESDENKGGLIDYKFFCFNGKVEFVYVICDRELGCKAFLGIFTKNFIQLSYYRADEQPLTRKLEKPFNYDEMVKIAETLSSDFPHARIDLYNQDGRILFGEITFFDGSGYMTFSPDEFDFIVGKKFVLSSEKI